MRWTKTILIKLNKLDHYKNSTFNIVCILLPYKKILK